MMDWASWSEIETICLSLSVMVYQRSVAHDLSSAQAPASALITVRLPKNLNNAEV